MHMSDFNAEFGMMCILPWCGGDSRKMVKLAAVTTLLLAVPAGVMQVRAYSFTSKEDFMSYVYEFPQGWNGKMPLQVS